MGGRLPDWETRFSDYLASFEGVAFEWGKSDCATFAAGAAAAITGVDNYAGFRGKYSTELGAAKALKKYGSGTLEATFDSFYSERPIGFARRGDLVFDGEAVGVCIGADAVFVGQEGEREGLVRKPRSEWAKAWAVGGDADE